MILKEEREEEKGERSSLLVYVVSIYQIMRNGLMPTGLVNPSLRPSQAGVYRPVRRVGRVLSQVLLLGLIAMMSKKVEEEKEGKQEAREGG